MTALNTAREQILELNRSVETRVLQRTAALDAANRELEAFSYTVSHDLRAPLRHVIGLAELLKVELTTPSGRSSARELADRLLASAAHMSRLIDAMLEFARTTRAPFTLSEIDLEKVLHDALDTIIPETQGRQIEWRINPLPPVRGDSVLLRQVFVNLLSNAVKYTRWRSPAIIEIGQRIGRGGEAVIYVRDNGAGFDMTRAGELFGVFKRLHDPKAFEGTGVGLATVHRIVSRHGGHIWADAQVDRGATFFFSLLRAE